jgi:hypothetical protein
MYSKQAITNPNIAQIQASRRGYSTSLDKNMPATWTTASKPVNIGICSRFK